MMKYKRAMLIALIPMTLPLVGASRCGSERRGDIIAIEEPERAFVLSVGNQDAADEPVNSGLLISRPSGIDCIAPAHGEHNTCFANFEKAVPVVLIAEASPGAEFVGFAGDCVQPALHPEVAWAVPDLLRQQVVIKAAPTAMLDVTITCYAVYQKRTGTDPISVSLSKNPSGLVAQQTPVTVTASVSGGGGPFDFVWQPPPDRDTGEAAVYAAEESTEVTVTVTDVADPTRDATATTSINVQLAALIAGLPGDPLPVGQQVTLSAQVLGGAPPYFFQWTGASGNGAEAVFTSSTAGQHAISVTISDSGIVRQEITLHGTVVVEAEAVLLPSHTAPVPPLTLVSITLAGAQPDMECYHWLTGSELDAMEIGQDLPTLELRATQRSADYWVEVYNEDCSQLLVTSDPVTVEMVQTMVPVGISEGTVTLTSLSQPETVTANIWDFTVSPPVQVPLSAEEMDCTWLAVRDGEAAAVIESHPTTGPVSLTLQHGDFPNPGNYWLHLLAQDGADYGLTSAIVMVGN